MYVINIKRLHTVADSNVGSLAGAQMGYAPCVGDAWLHIVDGKVVLPDRPGIGVELLG